MYPKKTQSKQKTKNSLHNTTTQCAGEEVQWEAIFIHRWASRVQCSAEVDRDPGEDLVPEQESQDQETPGVGAGETEVRLCSSHASTIWYSSITSSGSSQWSHASSSFSSSLHAQHWPPFLPIVVKNSKKILYYFDTKLWVLSSFSSIKAQIRPGLVVSDVWSPWVNL